MIWSCLFFFFFCIFSHFFKGAVGDRVLSCIISLLPKCLCQGSAGRTPLFLHIYGIVFPSSEAIWTVWEQPAVPSLKCWTDFLILKACVHECLFSFTGRMCSAQCCHAKILVMTSSLLSLLDCHDVNDSNSATTLRLCSYFFFFFLSTWPRCCRTCLSTVVISRKAIETVRGTINNFL